MNEESFVVFKIDGENYLFDILEVREIIPNQNINYIPEAKNNIIGAINLRGEVINIIDLPKKLEKKSNHHEKSKIIIVNYGNFPVGFLIDEVTGILNDDNLIKESAPAVIGNNPVKNIIKAENKIYFLLKINDILTIEELENLKKINHD